MEWLYVTAALTALLMVLVLVTGRGAAEGTADEIPPPPHPAPQAPLSVEQLRTVRFSAALRGYDRREVDALLDVAASGLESGGPWVERVREARFPVTLGGYRMDEVDRVLASLERGTSPSRGSG